MKYLNLQVALTFGGKLHKADAKVINLKEIDTDMQVLIITYYYNVQNIR